MQTTTTYSPPDDYVSEDVSEVENDIRGKLAFWVIHRRVSPGGTEITGRKFFSPKVIHRQSCILSCTPRFCSCETEGFEATHSRAGLPVVGNLTYFAVAHHKDRGADSDKDRKALSLFRNSCSQIYRFEAAASQRSVAK